MKSDRDRSGVEQDAERVRWVERYRASALGLKQFAADHGLSAGQLHYWIYGTRRAPSPKVSAPVFAEMVLPQTWATQAAWVAEIALPGGTTVRLSRDADVAWTGALVEALRRP